ncbi:MAG: aminotransferase class V-fold PLP-dependent enzyme [Methylovirgula sp.]|uniref:pyridoxal-phosphate-dependent aminotransferase family protein n=1 Tax=Methylovirgula sp. TaxID=1978224 RepID=UPI003076813B
MSNKPRSPGRHFLQIPGPTPIPDRVLRAIDQPVVDHRGPVFQKLSKRVLEKVKAPFKTKNPVIIFPSSGTGGWEAALVNTLSPGDKVLMFETGQFASLWNTMAKSLGLKPEFIESDWRIGADPAQLKERLKADKNHEIKAVCIVHNETASGTTSPLQEIREVLNELKHPALYFVDAVSSLASIDLRHDEWGIDVTIAGSQKGLMLPAGLGFNAVSQKALEASKTSKFAKSYWSWADMLGANASGFFPYTPATNLLYGLDVALDMLEEEGYDRVFARHKRHAEATRRAVVAWGLEVLCKDPKYYSPVVTSVLLPPGHDADAFRALALDHFDISLGTGLGRVAGKVFRIGHLADTNDLTILGALSGVEMTLELAGIPHKKGGVQAALNYIAEQTRDHSHKLAAAE